MMIASRLTLLAAFSFAQPLAVVRAVGTDARRSGSVGDALPPPRGKLRATAAVPLLNVTNMTTDGVCYPLNQTNTDVPRPVPCDATLVCELASCGNYVSDDPIMIKIFENELCPFPGVVQVRIEDNPTDDPYDTCSGWPSVACCMDPTTIEATDDNRLLGSSGAAPLGNLRATAATDPSAGLDQRQLQTTEAVCYPYNPTNTETNPVNCDPELFCDFATCGSTVTDGPIIIENVCPFPDVLEVRIENSPTDDPNGECSGLASVSCCMYPPNDDHRLLRSSGATFPIGNLRATAATLPSPQLGQRQLLPTTKEGAVCYELNSGSSDDPTEVVPCDPSLDCEFLMCGFEPSDDATASEILEYGLCPYDGPVQVRVERSSSDGPTRCYSSSVSCCVGPDSIWKGNY